ncbi:ferrous iron transport protein A [bacterium]|nr:ferrous iron transport protein A [bacterium]
MQTLSSIKENKEIQIDSIISSNEEKRSLEVLGFVSGTRAVVMSKAPFSGPVTIKLRGTKIAIRKQDADCILVAS